MTTGLHGTGRGPLGTIVVLVATGLALALAGAGPDRGPSAAEPATAALDPEALARISVEREPVVADRVETLRRLRFGDVPAPEVVSADRLGRIEDREIRESGGNPPIAADEAAARILGLLEPGEQLEAAQGASDQLAAAAYDTTAERLYVIEDAVGASPALVEFILAHELTHALEDQAFGLPDPVRADDDDQALAGLALVEGSATSTMVRYADRYLNALALSLAAAGIDDDTGEVPKFVVDQLEWAYLEGMRFVDRLYEVADGWKLVDYALGSRAPASTEQILHVAKYLRDERPVPVALEDAELTRRGWHRVGGGVLGEYGTRQTLALGLTQRDAARAATGWGGDRYGVWSRRGAGPGDCAAEACRERVVLVVRWRVDGRDGAVARRLAEALAPLGGVVSTGEGEVALVFAPDPALADAVAAANITN